MSENKIGSSIDALLKEEGIFDEAQAQAVKEVTVCQLAKATKKRKMSKSQMPPKTSRAKQQ
jgi:hypothetical protein